MEDSSEEVPPMSGRTIQEVDCGVDLAVAERMFVYLNMCEELKVDAQELEFQVLAPNEPHIDIKHIVMHARGERLYAFNQQGAKEVLVASVA